jgi:ribosomal protein L37AE/L43A
MLALFMAGVVLWLFALYQSNPGIALLPMLVLSVTAVGLAGGLGSRLALGDRSRALQLLAALAAVVLGLFALGNLTNWTIGLGPIEFWRDEIELFEVSQVGLATAAALLALHAWRRRTRLARSEARQRLSMPLLEIGTDRLPERARRGGPRRVVAWASAAPRLQPAGRAGLRKPVAVAGGRPLIRRLNLRKSAPVASAPRRGRRRRRPDVQLSMYAEHKCPFCLEDVRRNDWRGVEECPICHTLHHADCWEITGMCQVPHMSG